MVAYRRSIGWPSLGRQKCSCCGKHSCAGCTLRLQRSIRLKGIHPGACIAEQGTDMTQADGQDRGLMRLRTSHSARPALSALRRVSFGGPAAIVTSIGLIVGLNAATTSRVAIASSLLVLALGDNLTDALSVHIYQEAERLPQRDAFQTTVSNFLARLLVSLSFVALVVTTRPPWTDWLSILWGFSLLSALTHRLAKVRGARPAAEVGKHCVVAIIVVLLSVAVGTWVPAWIHRA